MEDAKISDLNVKIGRPYVYQHLGNCEHIIMFSDIRLLDTSDPIRFSCFPRVHCTGRLYGKHCMMCADFYARFIFTINYLLTNYNVISNFLKGVEI